jgi:uncharacterized protein YbjT (DUF2867 family)
MRVLLFGATGMIGQGVLRECLRDDRVTEVLAVGRTPSGQTHPKLRELVVADLCDLAPVADQLAGFDACFSCVGVSSAGMREPEYRRVTYDVRLSIAGTVAATSPGAAFVHVTAAGADPSGRSRLMWARVMGEAETAVGALPLRVWAFRPGYVQPLHGITSRTRLYAVLYRVVAPLYPVTRRVAPRHVTTTEAIGRAMIAVAADGWPSSVLTNADMNAAAR